MLVENVKVLYGYADPNIKERIHISNGTQVMGEGYIEGGRLPKEPWRQLNFEEANMLIGKVEEEIHHDSLEYYKKRIAVIKIPAGLQNIFKEFDFTNATNNDEARACIAQTDREKIKDFDSKLNAYLNEISTSRRHNKRILGIFALPPNCVSVGRDKESKQLYGLHFDNTLGLPLNHIGDRPNRISFNLSK